jgi:hypothetical protein
VERIRVASRHFWNGFLFENSLFVAALKQSFQVEIVEDPYRADLVFDSCFPPARTLFNRLKAKSEQMRGLKIPGKRVFYSGEPFALPVGTYHGVISSFLHLKENHFRYPLWVGCCNFTHPRRNTDPNAGFTAEQLTSVRLTSPNKFACAIFGNRQHLRFKAAQELGRFGKVDVLGSAVGPVVTNKMEILPDYKFNLCFENTLLPGYVTEKALQAKMAGCIPLYWGDPAYRVDFNAKSLINVYEYDCDFERIFNEVDFEEVRQTPLLNEVPSHYLPDMTRFLEGVMRAPSTSVF